MEKTYNPEQIEAKYRSLWEDKNLFSSNSNSTSENAYCIMLPPPNVTGSLHMGHAFQHTIMDVLTRYHRGKGEQTLWQPGTDHAGIATQMVIERQLAAQDMTRHDIGRDKFTHKIWDWKQQSGGTITSQMRRLGASVDWERERFTMDEGLSDAVHKVFIQLYNEDLIYRGKRLVNWDPVLHTAVSDLEVISTEEQGSLWHMRYPVSDSDEVVVVATTRPETMLGDSAVAVHSDDERYTHLIGQTIDLPLTGRKIPIIADDYVDMAFGTGCVKITPAHDFNDYEMGQRHNLEIINILTNDAKINDTVESDYIDMDRFEARKQIIKDLDEQNLLEKIEPHKLMVPRGDRTNAVIEPYLTDQWFVKVAPLAQPAIDAVKNGDIRFVPENWDKTYYNWMENIQDWCISRQIWWGHRIPAWYDSKGNIYVADSLEKAQQQAGEGVKLKQDEDVLDTWFSSALWPFSTLGWPEKTPELARFYPTNVLVTGFDIIFFWVARMIMFGLKFTGDVPFKDIYITGLIRDGQGQKMSKSKGNVLDPIDLIDGISLKDLLEKRTQGLMQPKMAEKITRQTKKEFPNGIDAFGTDALRFTFAALASFGRDIKFDLKRVEGYRNFCNKLWNASRFVLMKLEEETIDTNAKLSTADEWILSRLQDTKTKVEKHLGSYRLDLMSHELYEFVWDDYCGWYLEFSKSLLANETTKAGTQATLIKVLNEMVSLLHPIIPFITEEIFEQCNTILSKDKSSLMSEPYPEVDTQLISEKAEAEIKWLQTFVLGIRQIRAQMNISPNKVLNCFVQDFNAVDQTYLNNNTNILKSLSKMQTINKLSPNDEAPESATALVGEMKILIPLAGLIDKEQEIVRLNKEIEKLNQQKAQFESKLNNEKFVSSAPKEIVNTERTRLASTQNTITDLSTQLKKMNKL
ncbi:Valyl-tRNA synthetase (EC 6.1.1.9) [uncultured Gammaproteobacteria bacterium]|jgi:valyl-tRNA synthetase|uniref:Valine--tRNA ligase n=3 Tax=sulfur-oxidizing symbionts TaxID=32036 RepID=A0A1H6LS99_9GAMM|nr:MULTISPECIES: valine--tRNA ligase [sulfur-oxidizing symbionts]CAC5846299.1 Valyl-tRNA synthetase (EC 6.1.1.9) [uncultured Gammaproteobacteria bacterium]CAB5499019.1 Valyl-tRNA synthetase (EC [Bathymodiolus azoricus thioautotrophic gill symbiont]CAB5504911.1 Valyl-tRNA synthetase (EC [Bathymodiolus thermophilus thioautotrophic gill symbiont]CAC9485603.1 Valyl-tRNA synthetase (EC 6.1.1.9) [uncultured Gammaproteobacteria bacterium]CAC9515088.1 Valyl-tRNA synthetase (EC 6.1.1.9) [uncultured Gam